MQPLYTTLKVNNEIELCEVSDPDCKQLIERALLKNRISYYIRFFSNALSMSIAEKPDFLLYPLAEGFLLQPQKRCLHHLHQRQCQGCCGRDRPRDL